MAPIRRRQQSFFHGALEGLHSLDDQRRLLTICIAGSGPYGCVLTSAIPEWFCIDPQHGLTKNVVSSQTISSRRAQTTFVKAGRDHVANRTYHPVLLRQHELRWGWQSISQTLEQGLLHEFGTK